MRGLRLLRCRAACHPGHVAARGLAGISRRGRAHVRCLRGHAATPRAGLVPGRGTGAVGRPPGACGAAGRARRGGITDREPADDLLAADVAGRRQAIGALLAKASELARSDVRVAPAAGSGSAGRRSRRRRPSRPGPAGRRLRGALLLGADLRRADLRLADLAGADLRGADLRGADLRGALFVTRSQLESAAGDGRTLLSPALRRPTGAGSRQRGSWVPRAGALGISGPASWRTRSAASCWCPDAGIAEEIKRTVFKSRAPANTSGARPRAGWPSLGIVDISLAPTSTPRDSVAEILELIGVERVGLPGTTVALASCETG